MGIGVIVRDHNGAILAALGALRPYIIDYNCLSGLHGKWLNCVC